MEERKTKERKTIGFTPFLFPYTHSSYYLTSPADEGG
jgi:hypothetical protein